MPHHMEHKISNTTDFKRITTRYQWSSKFLHLGIFSNLVIFVPNKGRDLFDLNVLTGFLLCFVLLILRVHLLKLGTVKQGRG